MKKRQRCQVCGKLIFPQGMKNHMKVHNMKDPVPEPEPSLSELIEPPYNGNTVVVEFDRAVAEWLFLVAKNNGFTRDAKGIADNATALYDAKLGVSHKI